MKELFTPPVIWFLIGLALLLLEIAVPGLIIFFFGLGAWIVALLFIFFEPSLTMQLLIFIISSVLLLILLRKFLKRRFFKEDNSNTASLEEEFIGKIGIAESELKPGIQGRVSFKGTNWNAISDTLIKKGLRVKITGKESITLHVTKSE
jgi:membrane protein implicated in regulation of membrane protease activity